MARSSLQYLRHLPAQAPVLSAFARVLAAPLTGGLFRAPEGLQDPLPGPVISRVLPPRSPRLIADYLSALGTDPTVYAGTLPAHLFPQWTFPLLVEALHGLPYPMAKALNGGCTMAMNAPIPANEPLHCTAQLIGVDVGPRRILLTTRLVTGTQDSPEALVCEFTSIIPKRGPKGAKKHRVAPTVPMGSKHLSDLTIPKAAGLQFALLTGDFNPIHWVPSYAKMSGFKDTILHGFGTMVRAAEALRAGPLGGDPEALHTLEVRFTRPLVLPASVAVFSNESDGEYGIFVGDGPGETAYMMGRWTARQDLSAVK